MFPQRTRRWLTRAIPALIVALTVGGCASSEIEPIAAGDPNQSTTGQPSTTVAATTTVGETTTTRAATTTTTQATTTTTEVLRGTFDAPLPVGDPAVSGFVYSDYSGEWEGFIAGLVETDKHRWNDEEGRCVVLLGTLTPTEIDDGAVSSGFSTPTVSMIAEGKLIDDNVNECDTSDIADAGYGWILDAEVTAGTPYPFYTEFFLPGDPTPEIEVIVVGNPTDDNSLFYEPTILDTIPEPNTSATAESVERDVLPVGDPAVSGFVYSDYSGEWEGFIAGLVETDKHRWNDEEGRCVVLLGTLTPTEIDDGAVSSGFSTPTVSMIAEGKLIDDNVNECDTSDIADAGYGWILDAEVTAGTPYPFYTEFFLPGDPTPEIEVIVVGNPTDDNSLFYEPTILDTIPEPKA